MSNDQPKTGQTEAEKEAAEERIIEAGEQTLLEMQDAMTTMMSASTKMMQSFLDMRLSYLKVMRVGLDDPQSTFEMMSKNMQEIANSAKNSKREN